MSWLEQTLSPALVRALGWTLLHSLWQGTVVALALVGLLLLLRGHSARVRYATATAALLTLLLLTAVTFGNYYLSAAAPVETMTQVSAPASVAAPETAATAPTLASAGAVAASAEADPTGLQRWLNYFDQNLPIIVMAWLLGLLAMTLRLLGSLAYVQRLRHYRVQPLGADWQARLRTLSERAGVRRPVALLESARVRVPLVVGHLRPVILLPLGTVTGLSQSYLEAILAHELAHVVRRDYLLNLLQSLAEILFFYHPAVWFITAVLRTERENCCDDVATALIGGNPLTVARALAALAEQSLAPRPTPQLALSAVGPDGSLLGRIRRLAQGRTAPTFSEGFMAACVVLAGLVFLSTAVVLAKPHAANPPAAEVALAGPADMSAEGVGEGLMDEDLRSDMDAADSAETGNASDAAAWSREPLRILSISADGQALARIGGTQISFDTLRNQHMMRWNRQHQADGSEGTVTIRRDKKGRLLELYVNGEKVEIANAGTSAKDSQLQVVRLHDQPGAPAGPAATARERRMEELSLRMQQAALNGSAPSAADAQELSALALAVAREATSRQLDVDALTRQSLAEANNTISQIDFDGPTRDALKQAETELRNALKNAKTDDARDQLQEQLQELQDQQQEMQDNLRERQQELRDEMQERQQEMRERQQEMQEQRQEMQERLREIKQAQRDALLAQRDQLNDELEAQLLEDDLITDPDNYQLTLTAKDMTVNGKKQSAATQQKYRKLYEVLSGRTLDGTRSISINKSSSGSTSSTIRGGGRQITGRVTPNIRTQVKSNIRGRVLPMPPTPSVPPVSSVPPAAPLPPAPPVGIDSDALRSQLQADGLLGKNDKSFQFQLNSSGMKVNGQAQPAATADKYRRLFGGADSSKPGQKSSTNIQISVSE